MAADDKKKRQPPPPPPGADSPVQYPPLQAVRAARKYQPSPSEAKVLDACWSEVYKWGLGGAVALGATAALLTRRMARRPVRRAGLVLGAIATGAVTGALSTSARCMDSILMLDRQSRLRGDFITTVLRYNPSIVPVIEPGWEREVLERQREAKEAEEPQK